jgi:hypothetical protein
VVVMVAMVAMKGWKVLFNNAPAALAKEKVCV